MSKDLDRELAELAGVDEPDHGDAMSVPQPVEPFAREGAREDSGGGKRNMGLLVALLVMVGGIVALFMLGFQEASVYSMPVDQFVAKKADYEGRRIRIEGELVPGSLVKRDKPCEFRFRVKGESKQIEVRFPQCIVPDTFRDVPQGGVKVTAEGKLADGGHFEANNIMAKCSSKYDPETHTMEGAEQAKAPSM